ncbi:MAG: hypothetical protein ACTHKV_13910 [Flavipsychrobacter sp.]
MESFADYEIMIIEKEVAKKSYRDIAFLLDRSVEEVKAFVTAFIQDKNIVPFQTTIEQARKARTPVVRINRKKAAVIISRTIEQAQKIKRNRAGEIIYKTKVVDLSKMQEVRIDRKTCIYIKPGQDPQLAKEKYLQRLKDFRSRFVEGEKEKQVANFKP